MKKSFIRAMCVERGTIWNKLRYLIFIFHGGWRHFLNFPLGKLGLSFYITDIFSLFIQAESSEIIESRSCGLLHVCPIKISFHQAVWRRSYKIFLIKWLHLLTGYFLWLMWTKFHTQTLWLMCFDTDTKCKGRRDSRNWLQVMWPTPQLLNHIVFR